VEEKESPRWSSISSPLPWRWTAFTVRLRRFRADRSGTLLSILLPRFPFKFLLRFINILPSPLFSATRVIFTSPLTGSTSKWYSLSLTHSFSLFVSIFWLSKTIDISQQTVIELVDLVARRPSLPIVVCCSTRDDLDSLCSSLSTLPFVSSSALVSLEFSNHQLIHFLKIPTRYTILFT